MVLRTDDVVAVGGLDPRLPWGDAALDLAARLLERHALGDRFDHQDSARIFSLLTLVLGVVPGPFLDGLGKATEGKQVVIVPGNHDHTLLDAWFDTRARGVPLTHRQGARSLRRRRAGP